MMNLSIGFLTVVLVLDCLFLILLILIQLPKKEAGAGIAFGGAATDALFGAGSGTALTKITKYCAGLFLGLALFLSILNAPRPVVRSQPDGQVEAKGVRGVAGCADFDANQHDGRHLRAGAEYVAECDEQRGGHERGGHQSTPAGAEGMTNDKRSPRPECRKTFSGAFAGFVMRHASCVMRHSDL